MNMEIEPIIAGLNDQQRLNDKRVFNIFIDIFREVNKEEVDQGILEDALKIKEMNGDKKESSLASSILKEIDDLDMNFYEDYIKEVKSEGVEFVTFLDDDYPENLWRIDDPPLALYIHGDPGSLQNGVAVVGTREAKEHRIRYVKKIGKKLVELNHTVISGLANGVDTAAHESALEAGGKTVAVLPGDIQSIYPASNKNIGKKMVEKGALVSEVSSKISIHRGRFVERNRVTSGICNTIIIGASGETGGTIHQAKFAKQQGLRRFLYDPERVDGQSPEKLKRMGFKSFSNVDELEEMMNNEEWEEELKTRTLDDF